MRHRSLLYVILIGGTIAGTLDILFAVSFAAYHGATPLRLLQTVASGALGDAAFSGGVPAAALGLACHLGLSYLWAASFLVAICHFPGLARRPLLSGLVFGVVVFFVMRLVVLPISFFPFPVTFKLWATVLDLLSHMLLFGIPIAWVTSKAVLAHAPMAPPGVRLVP